MDIVYSDRYQVDIGAHVFPMGKYARCATASCRAAWSARRRSSSPRRPAWDDLALVHTRRVPREDAQRRLPARRSSRCSSCRGRRTVVDGFRLMAGGTIAAARLAVEAGAGRARHGAAAPARPRLAAAANLGGGFHHAFPSHGEGFCLYNDVAVAIRVLQRDGLITRAAVVDVDVHQGNGTAFIFDGDPAVFTFSIHQEHNYPHVKPRGSLDVGLPDGTGDHEYLHALERALPGRHGRQAGPHRVRGRGGPVPRGPAGRAVPHVRRAAGPRRPRAVVRARGRRSRRDRLRRRLRAARRGHRGHPHRHDRGSDPAGRLRRYAVSGQLRRSRNVIGSIGFPCGYLRASRRASHSSAGPATRLTQRWKRPSSCSMSLRKVADLPAHLDV